jgi:tRNA U34 5-carboxymethylaminomethyl modifying GTPase MnmE/TrmE
VLNKSDLAGATPTEGPLPRVDVKTCAVTGQGVDQLRAAILAHFGCSDVATDRPRVWTARQREVIQNPF